MKRGWRMVPVDVEDSKASLLADEQFLMRLRAQDEEFLKAAKEAEIALPNPAHSKP